MQLEVGSVLEGKVTGITKFGAFVALPDGKNGLIHISEIANAFVSDIHEFLTEGQTVKVCVLNISQDGKVSLSAKRAEEKNLRPQDAPQYIERKLSNASEARAGRAERQTQVHTADQTFEDKLRQFMQESDSRMSGNKLYEQQRRIRNRRK